MRCLNSDPLTVSELLEQQLIIRSLNNYGHVGIATLADHLNLKSEHMQKIIRVEHCHLSKFVGGSANC
ncbi:hypothetical protein CQJ94_16465 [Glycomyces fuscus]|nr:hypothetical protein CQJ94_16465 [Glycomyces fuscus]